MITNASSGKENRCLFVTSPSIKNATAQFLRLLHRFKGAPHREAALFKEKSEPYGSISHYIRCAVVEYSNVHVKQRLELIKELGAFYRKFQNELSWAGGNLNQSVKRANELSVAGLLPPSYVREVLLPTILETQRTLNGIKRELDAVTQKAVKL